MTCGTQPANIRVFTVADRPLASNQDLTGSFISAGQRHAGGQAPVEEAPPPGTAVGHEREPSHRETTGDARPRHEARTGPGRLDGPSRPDHGSTGAAASPAPLAFHQMRPFVEHRSALAGVPVALVDPRHTSRTCPQCGLIDKRNRPTPSSLRCIGCRFAGPADTIAAGNIARRAAVNQPHAGSASPQAPASSAL